MNEPIYLDEYEITNESILAEYTEVLEAYRKHISGMENAVRLMQKNINDDKQFLMSLFKFDIVESLLYDKCKERANL